MENNQETKRVKSSDLNKKTKRPKKEKTKKVKYDKKGNVKIRFKDKHPRIWTLIKVCIILMILAIIIGTGIVVGAFYGVFGDELKIDEKDLVIKYENSTVYDKDGNVLATLSGGTKRKIVSLNDMAELLPKAYVAIEDERFYQHSGVDIKRTGAAIVTYITHGGSSSFGGSSITQQLIKNITNDKENSKLAGALRKVKEISKAIQVEQYLSKDQILELYLNMIFVGGDDINGVELGSIYYFNKSAKDLSLAECAFMAGINHQPNSYKPFEKYDGDEEKYNAMQDKIKKRTKTVLGKMKDLEFINEDQYNEACSQVDAGLKFERGEAASVTVEMSYHTEAAIEQILAQIMKDSDMSESMAETYLYSSGLKIYTTQDSAIQARLEEELSNEKKYLRKAKYKDREGNKVEESSMASMVIIDNQTGAVVASSTGIGADKTKTKLGYFNWPTKLKKATGSSMKPLSVIAPGLENNIINGATVYLDAPTNFGGGYKPHNYYSGYRGAMNMRHAVEISANIPHVKAMADIGVDKAAEFCEKVGLPKFENEGLSLALGGLHDGVSVYQMAGAYAAIANDGVYRKPTFYSKVTDGEGNILYEPDMEETVAMSRGNAYIEKTILQEPVRGGSGTATYCAIKGMDVAAKTGTTNDDYDRWLCGFTPYYTAACWYGYEFNAEVVFSGNPAGKIWDAVMTDIHKELPNAKFEKPEEVKSVAICRDSGLRAKEGCTNVYNEYFLDGQIPEVCDGHSNCVICLESNLLATEFCPNKEERTFAYLPVHERGVTKWQSQIDATLGIAPTETCPLHTQPAMDGGDHNHVWGDWQTQSNGLVEERHCTICGSTEYRDTEAGQAAKNHTHAWVKQSTTATCGAGGTATFKCSGCGETKTEAEGPTGAHTFKDGKCTVCGAADPNYKPPEPPTPPTPPEEPENKV